MSAVCATSDMSRRFNGQRVSAAARGALSGESRTRTPKPGQLMGRALVPADDEVARPGA